MFLSNRNAAIKVLHNLNNVSLLESKVAGLVYGEELLRDLDAVQSHANQEVSEVMDMLDELHKYVQKLAPEKHMLEAKPKIKEQEGYPLMCRQEESEFESSQIEPCDADICQLEQKLQEDELERVATVQEKKAMATIKEQLYAQLGKQRICCYFVFVQCAFEFNPLSQMNHLGSLNIPKA